jgi:PAS domain S-box-containing protein
VWSWLLGLTVMAIFRLDQYFFPVFEPNPTTAYVGTYSLGLVATSVAIAILAALIALSISGRIIASKTPATRYAWVSAGAISMGGGIWSMHFVGMLAFSLPCGITYDPLGTILSMIPGTLASGIALSTISKPGGPGLSRRIVSAVLLGVGIATMHYAGMAAMRPEALLEYNGGLVVVSIVVAVFLAFVSLSILFQFHGAQTSRTMATVFAASVMGCAVAGMHYTAMQAALFFPLPEAPISSVALSPTLLALLITIFTVLIAAITLTATFAGRQSEQALSLSTEVSRRMCTEDELRRSQAYLAEAQRLVHTGSWAIDYANRKPVHSSEEHHRLFGFDPASGMPPWRDWMERIHPDDRSMTKQIVEQSYREQTGFEMDYRVCHPDGMIKYLHVVGHPIVNATGNVVEFVGTSVDVTERRQAEEIRHDLQNKLAHANRVTLMGQLTASIAHEVNQPIGATVTNAQAALHFLDSQPPGLNEVRQALAWIVTDGNRAGDVIGRIRSLVKNVPSRNERLDINAAILEVVALTRSEMMRKGVSLRTDLARGLPPVHGDRIQLQQVVLNLILNAVEAMGTQKDGARELLITTGEDRGQGVSVAVQDSGPGLDPESVERLFDAFYSTKTEGMGMGLAICRSIIDAHGGRIYATANAPRGAAFRFTVPSRSDAAA